MRKLGILLLAVAVAFTFCLATGGDEVFAAKKKYEKFAEDKRHTAWKGKRFKTSKKTYRWRASDTWGGLVNHDVFVHFCDTVRAASGGRLDIKPLTTGAVVGAFELFDAVSKGALDAGHSFAPYWKGKNEAFTLYGSVPFSMDYETYNIWYYFGGGKELMDELYGRYNLKPFFVGNSGQELGLFSKTPRSNMADFKGIKVRTVGWYMDVLNRMGVNATALPGAEVYLALERGIVDSAEFSSPTITYRMGFHEICKYVTEPGMHQPSAQMDFFVNMKKWEELPEDLKVIVKTAAKETQLWSFSFMQWYNAEAIIRLKEAGVKFVKMDDATLNEFRKSTDAYMDELKTKFPDVKKIIESQEATIARHAEWKQLRSGCSTWPREHYYKKATTDYLGHYQ